MNHRCLGEHWCIKKDNNISWFKAGNLINFLAKNHEKDYQVKEIRQVELEGRAENDFHDLFCDYCSIRKQVQIFDNLFAIAKEISQ